MANYNYRKYKILVDPESHKPQGFEEGDVVRRQYHDKTRSIYSLMLVTETGVQATENGESPYFVGALIEGDVPVAGELLDFVRVTSLRDVNRSGALYLTASDHNAPYMDVVDGMGMEKSLCRPYLLGDDPDGDPAKYSFKIRRDKYNIDLNDKDGNLHNVLHLEKTGTNSEEASIVQDIYNCPDNPSLVVIYFKARASEYLWNVPMSFGLKDEALYEFNQKNNIDTEWKSFLYLISIDYPSSYTRRFKIELMTALRVPGMWVEIAELNITTLSALTNFNDAVKSRTGKVDGIIDPVFGRLEGYAGYFQNFYATRNANIAGTLTAGDENGFSSAFYVGKIHKNVVKNSMYGDFDTYLEIEDIPSPTGMGVVWRCVQNQTVRIQDSAWWENNAGKIFCFSFWAKSPHAVIVKINNFGSLIAEFEVSGNNEWLRYHLPVRITQSKGTTFGLEISCSLNGMLLSSPQFEAGSKPSQYQPTDGILSYVEDYGAWFSNGGIGGTIQNPLLRLNSNGSISSRNDSFVINTDGSGHFSSGRFAWTKDEITLKGVVLKWADLDEETKEHMSPLTLEIVNNTGFTIKNGENDVPATAILRRAGKEVDAAGTLYQYHWKLMNPSGIGSTKTYSGKTITVLANDVAEIASLICEVSEIS